MVKGTSRITVMPHPRYSSRHTPATPIAPRCARMWPSARADEPPCCPACARCFTTSVGTRTAHAAISPADAATMCSAAATCPGLLLLLLLLLLLVVVVIYEENSALVASYVQKKKAAPGALPTSADPTPR